MCTSPLLEAQHRLGYASHAFAALLALLEHGAGSISAEDMYYLLEPIRCEVDAALDELTNA